MTDARRLPRLHLEGDAVALIQLPSGEERLEPVLELGGEGMAVLLRRSAPPLEPGKILPRVRLFNAGTCALDVQAEIREVTEVTLEGGGIGQRLGLHLQAPPVSQRGQAEISVDPQVIEQSLATLARMRTPLALTPAGLEPQPGVPQGRLSAIDRAGGVCEVELHADPVQAFAPDHFYDLHTDLFARRISVRVRAIASQGRTLRLSWPIEQRTYRGRIARRLTESAGAHVAFETPFHTGRRERPAVDLSLSGVAFRCRAEDGLMIGMVLPAVELQIPGSAGKPRRLTSRAIVRHLRSAEDGDLVAGVELVSLASAHQKVLAHYIEEKVYPTLRRATDTDREPLWGLYQDTGLVTEPVMRQWERIQVERRALLQRGADLLLIFLAATEDQIEGALELAHVYPRAWTVQHLTIRDGARLTADQLLIPALETAASLRTAVFAHALWPAIDDAAMQRLTELASGAEHLALRRWVAMGVEPGFAPADVACAAAPAARDDLEWAHAQLQKWATPLEHEALALGPRDLALQALQPIYRPLGLDRRRSVWVAMTMSEPLGLSLLELTSHGLNFAGSFNVARVIPTARLPEQRRQAVVALANAAVTALQGHGAEPMVLVAPADEATLKAAGYVTRGPVAELCTRREQGDQLVNALRVLSA